MYFSNLNLRLPQLPNQCPSKVLRMGPITIKNLPIDPSNNPRTTLPRMDFPKRIQHFPYPTTQYPLYSSYISKYRIHLLYAPRPVQLGSAARSSGSSFLSSHNNRETLSYLYLHDLDLCLSSKDNIVANAHPVFESQPAPSSAFESMYSPQPSHPQIPHPFAVYF